MHNASTILEHMATCARRAFLPNRTKWVLGRAAACRSLGPTQHVRGAVRTTSANLLELPSEGRTSSLDPLESCYANKSGSGHVVAHVRATMRKHSNCVVLTRIGQFYELYDDHAVTFGPLLGIKVIYRKRKDYILPQAGFPFYQLERYLKILVVDNHRHVAITEEYPRSRAGLGDGLKTERRVARIVTPGTLIDESFMDPYTNNFLLAIATDQNHPKIVHRPLLDDDLGELESQRSSESNESSTTHSFMTQQVGLAWLNLSTGGFFTQVSNLDRLSSNVARINASELIFAEEMDPLQRDAMLKDMGQGRPAFSLQRSSEVFKDPQKWDSVLEASMPQELLQSLSKTEIEAASMLLSYAQDRLQDGGLRLQLPIRKQEVEYMVVDRNTTRALEILGTGREGIKAGKGSLLHSMRRTVTKSGARLLRERLSAPSMSLSVINARLDLVTCLVKNSNLRASVVAQLESQPDSQKLIQRFTMGRADALDLVNLSRMIETTKIIRDFLLLDSASAASEAYSHECLKALSNLFVLQQPLQLSKAIQETIDRDAIEAAQRRYEEDQASALAGVDEDGGQDSIEGNSTRSENRSVKTNPPQAIDEPDSQPWTLRRHASPELELFHRRYDELQDEKEELRARLTHELGTSNLQLRWSPSMAWFCYLKSIRGVQISKSSSSAQINEIRSSRSSRYLSHSLWTELGQKLEKAKAAIRNEETKLVRGLREQVIQNLQGLRINASLLDELDISCAFATIAQEQNLARPILHNGLNHDIVNGRHLTVKLGLEEQGRSFVSNSCKLGDEERIWLITGPNMAGKSTFLRQNALISILAQVGSFVPADHAELGLVDQMFTRIGSADDLYKAQSTFMVEMLETATILKNATPQSFVIMDEIGRGTTPEDGVAISFACLHHLYYKNRSRTLFATHFHSLAELTSDFRRLACYCTDVDEGFDGSFSFVHRLRPGVNRKSHALKVARLAGLPDAAIETASSVLGNLESVKTVTDQYIDPPPDIGDLHHDIAVPASRAINAAAA